MKMPELPQMKAEMKLKVVIDEEFDEIDVKQSKKLYWTPYDTALDAYAKEKRQDMVDNAENVVRALALGHQDPMVKSYINESKMSKKDKARLCDLIKLVSPRGQSFVDYYLSPPKPKAPKPSNQPYVGEDEVSPNEIGIMGAPKGSSKKSK